MTKLHCGPACCSGVMSLMMHLCGDANLARCGRLGGVAGPIGFLVKGGRGPGGPCSAEGPRIRAISSCCSLMARARSGSLGEVLPPVPSLSRLGVAKSSSGGMGFRCPSLPYSTSLPHSTSHPFSAQQQIIHPFSHERTHWDNMCTGSITSACA